MAISKVQIANMALSNVGAKSSIESLTEASAEARQCNLWYDYSLQATLEAFDWGFARKRGDLAVDGEDPPDQWTYRYQYPADCVKFRRIWNPAGDDQDAVPWDIETNANGVRTILTDMEDAVGIYTKLVTNTALYTTLFIDALALQLAHRIAYKLTAKRSVKLDMFQQFGAALRNAQAADANEQIAPPPREAPWIEGR